MENMFDGLLDYDLWGLPLRGAGAVAPATAPIVRRPGARRPARVEVASLRPREVAKPKPREAAKVAPRKEEKVETQGRPAVNKRPAPVNREVSKAPAKAVDLAKAVIEREKAKAKKAKKGPGEGQQSLF